MMKKRLFILCIPYFFRWLAVVLCTGGLLTPVFAQKYATCSDAAEVNSISFGPIAPNGAVDKNVAKLHSHGLFFEKEHNITWLSFQIPEDTLLTFDIIPQKQHDDIDFLLFKDDDSAQSQFCAKIKEHKLKPLRTNLAKPDSNTHNNITGLSASATDSIVPSGNNAPFSKALNVKKGERYYLVIDNYTEAEGAFILQLHVRFPSAPATVEKVVRNIDAAPVKAPKIAPVKTILTINVTDSAGNPVKSQLDISGIKANKLINVDTVSYTLEIPPGKNININCNALGYMFSQTSFKSPDSNLSKTITIILTKVREHKSVVLKDIKFQEGVAIFLPSSQNELMNLLEFMKSNPKVSILIKGYVNDPGNGNSGAAKKLSKQRAEAVCSFLVVAGIKKERIFFVGMGNENMIYPNPINEVQEEANRRVVVEIIK